MVRDINSIHRIINNIMTEPETLDKVEVEFDGTRHTYSSDGRPYKLAVRDCYHIYVSGIVPLTNNGPVSKDFDKQVEYVLKVITEVAKKLLNLDNDDEAKKRIVKLTVYVVDLDQNKYNQLNKVFQSFFKGLDYYPARTTIGVSKLPLDDVMVEIDALISE